MAQEKDAGVVLKAVPDTMTIDEKKGKVTAKVTLHLPETIKAVVVLQDKDGNPVTINLGIPSHVAAVKLRPALGDLIFTAASKSEKVKGCIQPGSGTRSRGGNQGIEMDIS